MKKIFILLLFILVFPQVILAADFKSDYQVEYWPIEKNSEVVARVKFTISITNLRSDIYVKKIALTFPKEFSLENVISSDNKGNITPQINYDNLKTNLGLEFNDPEIGRDTVNTFNLEFDQKKLFQKNGNILEIFLPTMTEEKDTNYKVILNMPAGSDKKLSIAKPKPNLIQNNQIIWQNPTTKTIYAVFGEKQLYQVELAYHLKNPKIAPVYTDVVFPPDTLYQKNYITSIQPLPNSVFLDEDNNMIGRYNLNPKEKIDIHYRGVIELFIKPREEVKNTVQSQISYQSKYLLNSDKNWEIKDITPYQNLKNAKDIYSYIVSNLNYDYQRVTKDIKRYGANEALKFKNNAVCVEFSDIFVALAREKGIYAREIQGYAISQSQQLRPLSLVSDILHSWPEYYDKTQQIWMQVDPTWENTSGIDYYDALDLNHLAFVIHGKKSDYPYSAGMYKTEETNDISVKPVSQTPEEKILITAQKINFPQSIDDKNLTRIKFNLKNEGNTYLWNIPILIELKKLSSSITNYQIPVLAPYEEKEVVFNISSQKVKRKEIGSIIVKVMGDELIKKDVNIYPAYYQIAVKISLVILSLTALFLVLKIIGKLKNSRK